MTHVKARFALIAVGMATAVGVVAPTQAQAFVSYYNCVNKPSGQWCDGRANGSFDGLHSWDFNQASKGTGGVYDVCQQVLYPPTGVPLGGAGCDDYIASHYYGNVVCACYEAEIAQTSGSPKSINGFADAG